jgi:ribonuclease P protein component
MAAAVSSKAGMAVWRNRIKRLLKDSFRLNKEILMERCLEKKILLNLVLSPYSLNQRNASNIKRFEIEPSLIDLLNKIKKMI